MVVDGKEGKRYAAVLPPPIFSPDGQRVAYCALIGDEWMVVVDGKEGNRYAGTLEGTPIFSPDGQRVAYGAKIGDEWMVVVDGKESKGYAGLSTLIFSPDSQRIVYEAVGDKWMVVVDGHETTWDGIARGGRITFDAADRLHWVGVNGNVFVLASARIE